MKEQLVRTKVLVTVMTYPHPSLKHDELICTAGITETGEWVRLYPIDYRHRPKEQRFHKYQWIELDLEPRGQGNDNRKESRRPHLDTLRVLGQPIGTGHRWEKRRQIIDSLPHHTLNQLKQLHKRDKTSLGIVRPARVLDMKIEQSTKDWKPEWQVLYQQMRLFGPPPKPLKKIPFKFSYVFECEDSKKPHRAMCEDWELGVLYLKEVDRLKDEMKAARSVRKKFLKEICSSDKDTRFFMGTTFPFNSWVVIGTFYPPRVVQMTLF